MFVPGGLNDNIMLSSSLVWSVEYYDTTGSGFKTNLSYETRNGSAADAVS